MVNKSRRLKYVCRPYKTNKHFRNKIPNKISNRKLYEKNNEEPISIMSKRVRRRLFGHILRRDPGIQANQAMTYYFKQTMWDLEGNLESYYQVN